MSKSNWIIVTVAALTNGAQAQELRGFRLGMTVPEATRVAASLRQSLQTFRDDSTMNGWHSIIATPGGPTLAFCQGRMVSVTTTDNSNIHEFVSIVEASTRAIGGPAVLTQQTYVGGKQLSSIRLEWQLSESVVFSASFNGFAENPMQIARSYFNKAHTCR